jgi:2,3-bisphosphoglycerate-dependent phosphoglycerate mutase
VTVCYLLRHAQSAPSAHVPEPDWPLSTAGAADARALVPVLLGLGIEAVWSSPYKRAIDTVVPFAHASGLDVRVATDLRERRLTTEFVDDFRGLVKRAWADFNFSLPSCESSRECQRRMAATVTALTAAAPGKALLLSSHGNAIGLLLNAVTGGRFGCDDWMRMPSPALYRLHGRDGGLVLDESFGPAAHRHDLTPVPGSSARGMPGSR